MDELLLVQEKMDSSGMLQALFNLTLYPDKYVPVNSSTMLKNHPREKQN